MAEAPIIAGDDSERIQFLREALPDKDWRTSIIFPDSSPASHAKLEALKQQLADDSRNIIKTRSNERQQLVLEIHHMGHDTTLDAILREKGIGPGLGYMAAHPAGMAAKAVDTAGKTIGLLGRDPARLNGFIFTFAEFFLATAGLFGNSKQPIPERLMPMRKRANLLQTVAGNLFLGQSLIYLLLARNNDEIAMDQIRGKVNDRLKTSGAVEDISYNPQTDRSDKGVLGAIGGFIRRYPIQIGALFNVTGMFVYIGHVFQERKLLKEVQSLEPQALAALDRKLPSAKALTKAGEYISKAGDYVRKGWKLGILGCVSSIFAWSMLLIPHKQKKPQEAPDNNRDSLFGLLKDNPQFITSSLAVISSSSRLLESLSPGKRNLVQAIGEAIYIPGDVMLGLIHNNEYGDSRKSNDKLAKQLTAYIKQIPLAIGPLSQKELVEHVGAFLTQKAIEEMPSLPPEQRLTEAQVKAQMERTVYLVRSQLQRTEKPFDKLVESGIRLVNNFPEEMRPALRDQLIGALTKMPWVHATPDELRTAFESYISSPVLPRNAEERAINIRTDIGAIASIIPTADTAATATALFNIVEPFSRRVPQAPSSKISAAGAALEAQLPQLPARA